MRKSWRWGLLLGLFALLTAMGLAACSPRSPSDPTTSEEAPSVLSEHTETPTVEPAEESTSNATQEETTMEETTQAATTQEETTAIPVAGEDHGLTRDGTPKKYITIRMDDGITQDARMMEIMRKYGVDCCTFYINTALGGANWAWVGQQFNRPDVPHLRYTRAELQTGIYDGFDVECHTLNHPSLKNYSARQVTREVKTDAENIQKIFGYKPVGLAWPGGDTEWNEQNVRTILETTDIRYGSCTTRNTAMGLGRFSLPQYFMSWYPTCSIVDPDAKTLLEEFLAAECTEDMLYYLWGHGYELDLAYSWELFETMIRTIAEAAANDDTICLVTNAEFYQLFKDEIPSWRE